MKKTLCLFACACITSSILDAIAQQAGWNLSNWLYFGIGIVFGLIDIATDDKDN